MTKDESQLIRYYQFLTQYMIHSIKSIKGKNQLLSKLTTQQTEQNSTADKFLEKQVNNNKKFK